MVLSTKIQGVSMEVDFLRYEMSSTKEKLESIEDVLENEKGRIFNSSYCGKTAGKQDENEEGSSGTTSEVLYYMNVMRTAWKSEKRRARNLEAKINQELVQNKGAVSDLRTDTERDIKSMKETLDNTSEKVGEISRRLDTVESDVKNLQNDQAQLRTYLQADRLKMDKLELDFQKQQQELTSLNEELKSTRAELSGTKADINGKFLTLTNQAADREKCQSGKDVGAHSFPSRSFPYTVTVRFNPPFKKTPAFVYGTVVLDATDHTRYNAHL